MVAQILLVTSSRQFGTAVMTNSNFANRCTAVLCWLFVMITTNRLFPNRIARSDFTGVLLEAILQSGTPKLDECKTLTRSYKTRTPLVCTQLNRKRRLWFTSRLTAPLICVLNHQHFVLSGGGLRMCSLPVTWEANRRRIFHPSRSVVYDR